MRRLGLHPKLSTATAAPQNQTARLERTKKATDTKKVGEPKLPVFRYSENYCSSLVTSCSVLFAWARALMPVCSRISYLERFEVAEA